MRHEGGKLHQNDPVLATKVTLFMNLPDSTETKAYLFIVNKHVFLTCRKNQNWLVKPFSVQEVVEVVLPNGSDHKSHGALAFEVSYEIQREIKSSVILLKSKYRVNLIVYLQKMGLNVQKRFDSRVHYEA
jgi:hypothetical protein